MRLTPRFREALAEWAHRPPATAATEAAHLVASRLGAQAPVPHRSVLRPALAAAAAVLIAVVAAYTALRGHIGHRAEAGTTAALTLSSGTQIVIELEGVKP